MNVSVGLDIGWKDVKAVELTRDCKVTKIGKVKIPRPIKGDEIEVYATKIGELFKTHKFSKDNVIINLRGSPIIARTYSPPSKNQDDFEQWFVDSIESLIPGTPIADVVYDYHFLKSGRVLISFARLSAVENKIKILKPYDIIPAAIDASCLALYHAFDNHRWIEEKKTFAILDIGAYNSDLLVVKDGEPYISTEISFGGKDLKKRKDNGLIITEWVAIRYTPIGGERKWKVQITVGKSTSGIAEFSILGTVGEERFQIPDGIYEWKYTTRVKGDHPGEWEIMLNIKERILDRVHY